MRLLLGSKLLAGGLSAGLFLLWWPQHFPAEGLEWMVARGVLWTLCFEIFVLAFAPVERALLRGCLGRFARRLRGAAVRVPDPARVGGSAALAGVALLAPLLLLAGLDPPAGPAKAQASPPRVVRQVIVKRPVVRREVVVRHVTVAGSPVRAAAAPAAARPVAAPAPARSRVLEPARPGAGQLTRVGDVPVLYLTGGLMGALLVGVSALTVRTLGAGGVVAATVSGQLIVSALLDRAGVLGLEQADITPVRLAGFVLLVAGTLLVVIR
jgi:Putative inner membrane exporter, YdcZ